jgi:peptidoglycan/LPS O-acetylase OafA/YrhL
MAAGGAPYARFRAATYFPSLDALRALSILGVVAFHCELPLPGLLGDHGFLGVTLFFVISGFLITTLLLREQEDTGGISLRNFYTRRTLRIFPLYYAVLLAFCAATAVFDRRSPEGHIFWRHLPFFIFYMNNWVIEIGAARVIFAFTWSLATEEQFYLFWPFVMSYARRAAALGVITLLLVATYALRALIWGHWLDLGVVGNRVATSVAPGICLGCILAFALDDPRGHAVVARALGGRAAPLAALLAVLVVSALSVGDWVLLPMVALVASVVIVPDHVLRPVFESALVRQIGRVSYGMYLLFTLVINVGKRVLHLESPWSLFAWTLPATLAVASVVFRYYETPFLALKKRFSPPRRRVVTAGPDVEATAAAGGEDAALAPELHIPSGSR